MQLRVAEILAGLLSDLFIPFAFKI